jgi:CDP-diacylglycerol--glycerol-3-phosphate 3-phosphatidyltransferase
LLSGMFAVASFTDWLDGYLARRWDITSAFGAFLDPVADKLMVSTALILLSGAWGAIVAIPTAIILAREIAVSALREWMAQRGMRDSVKVGYKGKVKTALTMVSITLSLLLEVTPIFKNAAAAATTPSFSTLVAPWAIGMLWLSAYITIDSGLVYFRAAAPVLLEKE